MADKRTLLLFVEKAVIRLFFVIPIALLALMALSWLRYGIDLPHLDDWRDYNDGTAGSFKLSFLFRPANDTLYPVGRFLDSLAFRLLDGNAVAYQFVSMIVVLGLLLFLQWRLLKRIVDDRFAIACCFATTVLMLQPGTYWGIQSLAYHQAIPLICLLAILDLAMGDVGSRVNIAASALFLGLVSGLAYISGAFAMAVGGGLLCLVASKLESSQRGNIGNAGIPTLIAGLATLPAQLWVIIFYQHGTHRADAPMAYPYEYDFWMYLFGKVAQALMLPGNPAWLSLTVVLAVIGGSAALAIWCLRPLFGPKAVRSGRMDCGILLTLLGSVVFVYLLLVTAGRANLRDPAVVNPWTVFSIGYLRFHFFWVTLLWPWIAAALFFFIRGRLLPDVALAIGSGLVCVSVITYAFAAGVAGYGKFFRTWAEIRSKSMGCLIEGIQLQSDLAECNGIDAGITRSGVDFGVERGASFARLIRYLRIDPVKSSGPPEFKLSAAETAQLSTVNTSLSRLPDGTVRLAPGADPMLLIDTTDAAKLETCTKLSVTTIIEAVEPDVAELFYLEAGQTYYSQEHSRSFPLAGGNVGVTARFDVRSSDGFGKVLRLDPVAKEQPATVRDLEVRCGGRR